MATDVQINLRNVTIGKTIQERIDRQTASLARRLTNFTNPILQLNIDQHPNQKRAEVDLFLSLGSAGQIVSHQSAETVDVAVKQAVDDAKKQLERRMANLRGEPSYGVPSRRLPEDLRPNPVSADAESEDEDGETEIDAETAEDRKEP